MNCTNQTAKQYILTASANGVTSGTANVYCLPSLSDSLLGLMRTGQTTSYATGDDGTHQKTMARNYTDNEDGTVTDGVGRIWQKCGRGQNNDSSCSGFPLTTDWTTAGMYCSGLNLASKTWGLPTVQELTSLIDADRSSLAIDTVVFPSTQSSVYWSSTTVPITSLALTVFFGSNSTFLASNALKTSNFYVRCVSEPSSSSSNFTDNGDGTITDSATKLVWQKCANGQNATTCSGTATTVTWVNAISYCSGLSFASKTWRLPNRNELLSIVDYSTYNPSINGAFPSTENNYWSSTAYTHSTTNAWVITFGNGSNGSGIWTGGCYVRCVSGP